MHKINLNNAITCEAKSKKTSTKKIILMNFIIRMKIF